MNLEEKRKALLKVKDSPGWKNKILKMNREDLTKLFNQMNFEGKLVKDEAT